MKVMGRSSYIIFLLTVLVNFVAASVQAQPPSLIRTCKDLLISSGTLQSPIQPKGITRLLTNLAINSREDKSVTAFRTMILADWKAQAADDSTGSTAAIDHLDIKTASESAIQDALGGWYQALYNQVRREPLWLGDEELLQKAYLNSWPGEAFRFDLQVDGDFHRFEIHEPGLLPAVSMRRFWRALASAFKQACLGKDTLSVSEIHFSHVHPVFDVAGVRADGSVKPLTSKGHANFSTSDLRAGLWLSRVFPDQLVRFRAVTLSNYAYEIDFLAGAVAQGPTVPKKRIYTCVGLDFRLGASRELFFEGIRKPRKIGYFELLQKSATFE